MPGEGQRSVTGGGRKIKKKQKDEQLSQDLQTKKAPTEPGGEGKDERGQSTKTKKGETEAGW